MTITIDGQTYPDLATALRNLDARPHKYGARASTVEGVRFDSEAEARRYTELQLLAAAGAIQNLRVHPRYELQPGFTNEAGQRVRPIYYEADFEYTEAGRTIVEDVKGARTPVFNLKAKLFQYRYPDLELRIAPLRQHKKS